MALVDYGSNSGSVQMDTAQPMSDREAALQAAHAVRNAAWELQSMVEQVETRLFGEPQEGQSMGMSPAEPAGLFPVLRDSLEGTSHAQMTTRDALTRILERLA